MKLDEFVKTVMIDILNGIRAAQRDYDTGAFIVAQEIGEHDYASHDRVKRSKGLSSTIIDFDIAISAEESSAASGEGGLKILGMGAGVSGDIASKDSRVTRIQFAIPVILPISQKSLGDWGTKPETVIRPKRRITSTKIKL